MNPNKEIDRTRLGKAKDLSYRHLAPFRNLQVGLVQEYAGPGYGDSGVRPHYDMLVNLMNQTVDAYTMSLAANRPRVLLSTKQAGLKYFAKQFEVATNNLIEEIQLEYTLRQAVLDAFFCIGIVKAHMADSIPVMLEEGLWMDPGTPFASCISLDNWVHDTSATRWDKVKFEADSYRIPFEDLESDMFDQKVVRDLSPTSRRHFDTGDDRLDAIAKGNETDPDEFEPMIDLTDFWIPRDNKIYTFPMHVASRSSLMFKPIADMDWDGPEFGPYHKLSFNDVSENIMPTSPASHLAGLARLINTLLRKEAQQAREQKSVGTYTPAGAEDAAKIMQAGDKQWVSVQDTNEVKIHKTEGVDPETHAFTLALIEMFDRMAGNLSAMMGLGAQAETYGQEKLIYGAVSKKEAQMQYRTLDFTRGVVWDLGYMLWQDEVKYMPGEVPIEGTDGYTMDVSWTPEQREGDFFDYNFDIDVFSMPYQSPAQRVEAINKLITQIYAPMSEVLMQQGGQLNLQKLTDIYADLLNLPRLKEVVEFVAPMPEEMAGQAGSRSKMPPQTSREYIRRSVPTGGTAQNRQHVQQSEWLNRAGQNNPDQQALMPTGG